MNAPRLFPLVVLTVASLAACSSSRAQSESRSTRSSADTVITADNCLGDQDLDAADVDVSACPPIPALPDDAPIGGELVDGGSASVSLGAWEIGTTTGGDTYKYGSLTEPDAGARMLEFDGGTAAVNAENLVCWAKGYYRLRAILQNPPREYVALRNAHFQYRFFQFQTDLRNGATGYRKISSYMDHLVKWVTVVSATGECQQPTLGKFRSYAASELTRRGLVLTSSDAGSDLDAATP